MGIMSVAGISQQGGGVIMISYCSHSIAMTMTVLATLVNNILLAIHGALTQSQAPHNKAVCLYVRRHQILPLPRKNQLLGLVRRENKTLKIRGKLPIKRIKKLILPIKMMREGGALLLTLTRTELRSCEAIEKIADMWLTCC